MPSDRLSDGELIALLAAGDNQAATMLYDRHCRLLWTLVLRIVRDPADSEDVIQDLFVRVWQQCRGYDPQRGEVKTWLCQMARTMAIDRLRASTSRSAREKGYGDQLESDAAAHSSEELDPAWALVRRAVGELPDDQRSLIETAYYEGFSQSEIAERYGLPLGTVKTRIRQGMARLRERLGM